MSHIQSTRRLSLLAGSSLVGACVGAAVNIGVMLAPTSALAQSCSPATPPATNPGPDTYTCTAGTYPTGIQYSSSGNLSVTMIPNGTTVNSTMTANGVDLDANGSDSVTWDSTIGTVTGGASTNGPVIEVTSGSGPITIRTAGVTGSAATITKGISAVSSGGGAINITSTGTVSATNSTSGQIAIEAISLGATGSGGPVTVNSAFANGRTHGIYAQSSGTSALTINLSSGAQANTAAGVGVAGIEARAGGALAINFGSTAATGIGTNTSVPIAGGTGNGILAVSGANTTINLSDPGPGAWGVRALGATNAIIDVTTGSSSTFTLNNTGATIQSTASSGGNSNAPFEALAIKASGGRVAATIGHTLWGRVDFSDVAYTGTGPFVSFAVTDGAANTDTAGSSSSRGWMAGGVSVFSNGDDVLSTSAEGGIYTAAGGYDTTFDFGDGNDIFNNAGLLVAGQRVSDIFPTTTRFESLESWNNSGTVRMGTLYIAGTDGVSIAFTDGRADDLIVAEGTTFNGLPGSRLELDVDPSGVQSHCTYTSGTEIEAGDCLNLVGGATSGQTLVSVKLVKAAGSLPPGHYNPLGVVIVDVGGGDSAAGHFVIDPAVTGYSVDPATGNGVIAWEGLFFSDIVYSPDTQRHALVTLPKAETLQFTNVFHTAQSAWRTATGSWFDRQADRRSTLMGESVGGVWLRVSGEKGERELIQPFADGYGNVRNYDSSYDQTTSTVAGGADFVVDVLGGSYTVGAMLGYIASDVEYRASDSTIRYTGGTVGGYASYVSGGLYVDAMVNGTVLLMDMEPVGMELRPGTLTTETVQALGGRVDAGYRLPLGGDFYVEPLASAAYVRSDMNGFGVPGATLTFDNSTSTRAGLGVRAGADSEWEGFNASFSLTGRVWEELDGESTFTADNDGPDLVVTDAFDGRFGEIGIGASLSDASGTLGAFVDWGLTFGEGYQAQNVSAGLRYRW